MKSVLLHICCAPCSIYPIKVFKHDAYNITGYFYNPNIHPLKEFNLRKGSLKALASFENIEVLYDTYEIEKFFMHKDFFSEKRCYNCYFLRLEKTAKKAKELKKDFFTTTLLYSKRQKHDMIKMICEEIAKKEGIHFYYKDFRDGWKLGIEKSKELSLYRQNYCGCIFSEKERFYKDGE